MKPAAEGAMLSLSEKSSYPVFSGSISRFLNSDEAAMNEKTISFSSDVFPQTVPGLPVEFLSLGTKRSLSGSESDLSSVLRTDWVSPNHEFNMQFGGGFSPTGMGGAIAGQPNFLGLRIVPYLMLAERYDSNVFYSPALPGLDREDYVTSFSPGLYIIQNTRLVNASLNLAATGEYYAVHPDLNYVGFNGTLTLTMNELVRRVAPGASFLVAQSVNYSPSLPGFTANQDASAAPLSTDVDITTALVRSTALYRVNTLSATSTVAGSMPLTSSVLFQANYGYSIFRFGTPAVNEAVGSNQAQVINSTSHSAQAGPAWRITSSDTISLRGVFEDSDYGGGQGGYKAIGASLGWTKMLSPTFNFRVYGGATKVEQDFGAAIGAGSATEGIAYTGGTSVVYAGGPQMVTLTYTLGLAPSFVAGVGALQSHVLQLVAGRRLSDSISISGGFTYNHSKALDNAVQLPGTFFESYSGYGSVSYRISQKYFASLSYMGGTYRGDYFTSEITSFGRNAVTLTVSSYWF